MEKKLLHCPDKDTYKDAINQANKIFQRARHAVYYIKEVHFETRGDINPHRWIVSYTHGYTSRYVNIQRLEAATAHFKYHRPRGSGIGDVTIVHEAIEPYFKVEYFVNCQCDPANIGNARMKEYYYNDYYANGTCNFENVKLTPFYFI